MTRVALLWHMHQPYYEDLVTGEHMLPWVRFHALKDYYGMVALLQEFPDIRVTFNLVPSLLVQIEAFAANRARDRVLELSLRPADQLTDADVLFVLRHFFHAQRQRLIDVHPRYAELLERRGDSFSERMAGEIAGRFSVDDLRDLQVWHKLAWIDPLYMERDPRIGRLLDKGRQFTEADKQTLREVELEILNAVIPAYRAAASEGRIEVSTSPFYHPILPLLCDTEVYTRTHPDAPRPRRRFSHPEDAAEQLQQAVAYHARVFGERPAGLWPSEGSVSPAMVPIAAAAGFTWMATDELILARTLGVAFSRDRHGRVDAPERLYRPYIVTAGTSRIACAFRDHALSDQIGFVYAGWPAERAADDLVARLEQAGREYAARTGGGEAFIPVILDGENAWEQYAEGGRPFLRALYGRLSRHPSLKTVTMAEGCAGAREELPDLFPGSWIDGNFFIWIGHADDRKAWSQLAEARAALDEARDVPAGAVRQAREEMLIAEGSDWFWWYGDDHSSEHDLEFDDLFRRHLRNVYRRLDRPPLDELFASNISTGLPASPVVEPVGLISPRVDGEVTSYFEWLGAGCYASRDADGTMHQAARPASVLSSLLFGFDPATLFVRVDLRGSAADLLADGTSCLVRFLEPAGLVAAIRQRAGSVEVELSPRAAGPPSQARAAAGAILEIAVPLAELTAREARLTHVRFFVGLEDARGVEIERHPAHRPVTAAIPDARFEFLHWRA